MIVLAVGSVGAGAFLILGDRLADFLAPVSVGHRATGRRRSSRARSPAGRWWLVAVGASPGRCTARRAVPAVAPARAARVTVAARKDLYGDAVNESRADAARASG